MLTKFSCAAILVREPNRRTHFWKRTIQWLFHQNLVLIEQMVSDKKIFLGISYRVLCWIKFGCGGHLGRRSEMSDTILEGDHPWIISAKFGWDWLSSFRGEDFFLISSPLFSNFHNRWWDLLQNCRVGRSWYAAHFCNKLNIYL